MSGIQSQTHRLEKHAARLDWLKARPALLAKLPGANQDVDAVASDALDEALRGLKSVRLYAPGASSAVVRWGIRLCVSAIRGEALPSRDLTFKR